MHSLKPIEDNRAQNIVKCPLCSSVVAKSSFDQTKQTLLCQTCLLCPLGEEVMGLNININ